MSVISRGIKNAFRNQVRTISIVVILGLSIGLALSMLVARHSVEQKIDSVKANVGTSITISPAGVRGFEGGGNPLTQDEINKVKAVAHVATVTESLNDRLTSSNTNLQSSVDLGQLGQRFLQRQNGNGGGFGGNFDTSNFTPPVTVIGTTDPSNLANTQGGGNFTLKSGKVFDGNSTDNVALVGTSMASKNNLSVGSTFTAYGSNITVLGIFDSGNTFSNSLVVMPLTTLQTLSSQPGDVTGAVATVDSIDNLSSATSSIQSTLGSAADVTNDQTRSQNAVAPLENIKTISLYSLIGAVIAGSVIILLTMLMIVRERRREIGVLKAIGASNSKVMGQFMSEATTFTVLGAVVGVVLGALLASPITHALVNNSTSSNNNNGPRAFGGANNGAGRAFGGLRDNLSNIHAAVGWDILMYGLAAALVIALVGSAVASWLISRVRPAEVMRAE